jgi:hydroxymethylpyrimidine/phosphomethylpyrimidine kinase
MTAGPVDTPLSPLPAIPIALTIAGSDSGGGAGIQADLKTFSALGVYGASAITALTAQNTLGVQAVEAVPPAFVSQQIHSVLSDLDVRAAKTGMLATSAVIDAVLAGLAPRADLPLVVDPVMIATSGDPLIADEAIATVRTRLLPRATLLTPNLAEAARLLEAREASDEQSQAAQGRALLAHGAAAVLVKGGHGRGPEVVDVLVTADGVRAFRRPRLDTPHTHGTGCTLSAAVAAGLARGLDLPSAVGAAQDYVWHGLLSGRDLGVGRGRGPVDHLWAWRRGRPFP